MTDSPGSQRADTAEKKLEVTNLLLDVWEFMPELRLGQLIANLLPDAELPRLRTMEDYPLVHRLRDFYRTIGRSQGTLPPGPEEPPGYRVAFNLGNDRTYQVAELTPEAGLVSRLSGLTRWQALAIVSILESGFKEE